jgi:hypothetical protein
MLANIRCAAAGAIAALTIFAASAASAGRIVVDAFPEPVDLCLIGSNCIPIASVMGDVYVYSNGVVSIGAPISGLANDGTWFAPGALSGGSFEALAVRTNLLGLSGYFDGLVINFYAAGTNVVPPNGDDDPGTTPLMQVQIGDWDQPIDEFGDYTHLGTQVAFAYAASPESGARIGYNITSGDAQNCDDDGTGNLVCNPQTWAQSVTSNGSLNLGLSNFLFNFADGTTDLDPSSVFDAHFDAVASSRTPEPATWASLALGFGVIGSALRRRNAMRSLA